jgi:hypothetical protein
MPRYFFHIRDGNGLTKDAEGVDLPDLDAARAAAVKKACRIWSERPPEPAANDQIFEVTHEAGRIVLTVAFSEAFAERAVT